MSEVLPTINEPEEEKPNENIVERLKEKPITLIDKNLPVTIENIRGVSEGKPVLVLDACIKGMEEQGEPLSKYGYKQEEILNIDHHFNIEKFSRQISTTNLALDYVKEFGPVEDDQMVIVNHTDADSLLSSAIMRGLLSPDEQFGIAAIAADHTGEANHIADVLNAVEQKRDMEFSYRNLELYLSGKPLEPEAQELLEKRYREREDALRLAEEEFKFSPKGKVAYIETAEKIDSALLPAVLPSAEYIIVMCPRDLSESKEDVQENEDSVAINEVTHNFGDFAVESDKQIKIRLGMAAPDDIDLRSIMAKIDDRFGGRWNAGGNSRTGGTHLSLEEYVAKFINVVEVDNREGSSA